MIFLSPRLKCVALLVSVLALASCSSSGAEEVATTPPSVSSVPTTVVSTTTVAASTTTTSAVVVPAGNCAGTEESLATAVGEPLGFFVCDKEWAAFMTKDYVSTCENCESAGIAQWVNGSWEEIGNFNQYFMLSPSDVSKEMTAESLCAIWSTNRSSQFITETGCTPDS